MTRTSARINQKAIKTARKEKRGFPMDDNIHFDNVSDCWNVFPQRFIDELNCDELSNYHTESIDRDTCFNFDEYIESINAMAMIEPATVPIMLDLEDSIRTTHLFERGNWLMKGKVVNANTPETLTQLST